MTDVVFLPTSQSEEDKQLQEDLEMMVERLGVSNSLIYFKSAGLFRSQGAKALT